MKHKNRDIRDGFLLLILLVFVLFLSGTRGLHGNGQGADPVVDLTIKGDEISSFNRITLGLPVSINKETAEGLTAVPGIGPVTADAIVKARDKRGGFKALEELMSVRGIGDKTYNKIRSYVTL